ncbi:lipocalin-like domain-containing protein [Bradyrhizobium diazoefficiens]|uniref:lipocalin-like domain-containing protein n=1 Tax=Bradyrhizobium diazoefficiens TaxID=1355477 RepID=UPI00190E3D80|nr:lipocalin-like domain-containing protein [Bradyrhizobium diazoefficiens]MBK3664771.1 lipocalin-like domain-containing protein [Bradyrhizobium diazoefficiens]
MRVIVSLLFIVLSFSLAHASDDTKQKLRGVWKLESFVVESIETKERRYVYGEKPNGYLIVTPERFTAIITGQGRKPAQTDQERSVLLRSMFAYTGPYTVEGDHLTTKVDVSWNEIWTGTDQVRTFQLDGDKLFVETLPAPGPNQQVPGLVKGILSFSRSK